MKEPSIYIRKNFAPTFAAFTYENDNIQQTNIDKVGGPRSEFSFAAQRIL